MLRKELLEVAVLEYLEIYSLVEDACIVPAEPPISKRHINSRMEYLLAQVAVLGEMIHLLQLYLEPSEDVFAPGFESSVRTCICLHKHIVVRFSVIAEDRCRVQDTLRRLYTEAILHQEGVGEEAHRATIPIGEGVDPHKAVVGERYFDQIIAWVIFSADKVYKLVHIPIDRHGRRGQVLGLSDHSLPTSECSRGVISPLTTPRGESTDDALM